MVEVTNADDQCSCHAYPLILCHMLLYTSPLGYDDVIYNWCKVLREVVSPGRQVLPEQVMVRFEPWL